MTAAARGALLGALLIVGLPRPTLAASAEGALVRAVHARRAAAYRGEQIVANWLGDGVQVTFGHVEHDPPGWTRLEYRPVGSTRRWVVLRRATTEIQYDPVALTGTRGARLVSEDEAFLADHLSWLLTNYRISVSPGEVLGRRTERLVIRPITGDRPTHRIDVDGETGVVLRAERTAPDGRLTQVTAFVVFEVMPRGWRTDARLPRGLRLTERAPLRRVSLPDAAAKLGARPMAVVVPRGFRRVADYLTDDQGPLLQTVYSDGLSVLVLSSQRGTMARPPAGSRIAARAAGPIWVRQWGQRTLVHWFLDGWLLTLVGDTTPDALLEAAVHTGVARAPRVLDHLQAWFKGLLAPF